MATFSEHLRSRSDAELVTLLGRRPDLANPAPSTLVSLAARATSRFSLERALAAVDASVLQVLEAVVALDEIRPTVTLDDVGAALGAPMPDAVARALELALLWGDGPALHAAPGLGELVGPYPAGLGPVAADSPLESAVRTTLDAALDAARTDPGALARAVDGLLADAPPGAREVLDALAWGPPVGRVPAPSSVGARAAVDWLRSRGLLRTADAARVLLPREVGLALRGGRTHREPAVAEPLPAGTSLPVATVEDESARGAQDIIRLIAALIREWERVPPPVLRSGGLGVRELRRVSAQLDIDDSLAALVVELAGAAGLVIDDSEDQPTFSPTLDVDDWLDADLPDRWATLATAWLTMTRTPWVVGGRDERGELRAALDPELSRPWAPRLRHAVLDVLAAREPGTVLDADEIVTVLRWRTPRSVPPLAAVEATLREAGALGVLGAQSLTVAGRALLHPAGGLTGVTGADKAAAADAIAAALPAAVSELLLQGDLTGIVPGRPTRELASLLERAAKVESRGAAVTVRFTTESVRAALDGGQTADELLAELTTFARGPVPQPLDYLVRDAARRHGRLRVGAALGYVRSEDPMLLAGLVEDPTLADLGLVRIAPTVLVAHASPSALLAALRDRGLSPAGEGPDGQVVHARPIVRRVRAGARRRRGAGGVISSVPAASAGASVPHQNVPGDDEQHDAERLALLVPALRRAETQARSDRAANSQNLEGGGSASAGTVDPVAALATLREAAADGREVWLEIVGPQGTPRRRRVRPLRVDAGRVRAVDTERDAELTVAVHRIAGVTLIK
ncbi:helicase-associated domain-containing protein [Pengzhenrongella sicca]|uniref:Helicase-associated domain-containing protein n=1 Tax=Pengzhenrongella sicca TaxID=2819238 RepID=A0A8A4ZCY1_9MICO|nr:helicase-associated domain-containing protein [Pengzhenrongella sicca]QTE29840.1 helicase-associated domain-containing protein [Pengzhenrongella sicca]